MVGGTTVVAGGAAEAVGVVAVFTVGGVAYTAAEGASAVVVGGSTVHLGGPAVTLSGNILSLGPSGVIVDGSKTVPFSNTAVATAAGTRSGSGAPAQYTGGTVRPRPASRLVWSGAVVIVLALII